MACVKGESADKRIEVYQNLFMKGTPVYLSIPDHNGVIQVSSFAVTDVDNVISALESFKKVLTATFGSDVLK